MRLLGLSVLLLAGCSDNGAHLTFSAPQGPSEATMFRVVLATPERVPSITNQRIGPTSGATHTVSYYLQRSTTGTTEEIVTAVDGFRLRVSPDGAVDDTQFIPFVLFYDAGGAITGVGTYRAPGSMMPSPILVVRDEIDKYTLDVEPVQQVGDEDAVGGGQVQVVTCSRDGGASFTSGIVWRPKTGGELRLLFPAEEGATDATGRPLDLDCDDHPVTIESSGRDCDDTRDWFHRDAEEMCDGQDTNCDGLQSLAVACVGTTTTPICADPATNTGIALCNDRTGEQSACQSDPQCLCATDPSGCPRCIIDYTSATQTTVTPCQPAVSLIDATMCTELAPCTVEVLGVQGGWKAEVADANAVAFGTRVENVAAKFVLKVKRPEGVDAAIPGQPAQSTGDVALAIVTADGSSHVRIYDLQISGEAPASCSGGGPFQMFCTP